jgi:hypothetical protein
MIARGAKGPKVNFLSRCRHRIGGLDFLIPKTVKKAADRAGQGRSVMQERQAGSETFGVPDWKDHPKMFTALTVSPLDCHKTDTLLPWFVPTWQRSIEKGEQTMGLILLLVILFLLFGGGGYYGYRSGYYGGAHYGGGLTLVVVIIVLFLLFGGGYYR